MVDQQTRPWGRIRIRRDQAVLLLRVLNQERSRVTAFRDDWKVEPSTTSSSNRATALIDATREEIWRLINEMGWDIDDY